MARNFGTDLAFILGAKITGLPAAVAAGQPVTFEQFNALVELNSWKVDVRVSAPANVNLSAPGATIDGLAMANGDRFLVGAQTTNTENGIYVYNGASTPAVRAADANAGPELVSAFVPVAEGTSAGVVLRQTAINITLGTTPIGFVSAFSNSPAASTSTAGIAAFATQAEVDAGAVTNKTVTPQTLAGYANGRKKLAGTIGDGTATQFTITHNFNTRDVQITVYRNGTPWDTVLTDEERPTVNSVIVRFASAPAASAFSYVVTG